MHGIGLQAYLRAQAARTEAVIDGQAKVHAGGEQAQGQVGQLLPAQAAADEVEMPLIIEQAHACFGQLQAGEVLAVEAVEIGQAKVELITYQPSRI